MELPEHVHRTVSKGRTYLAFQLHRGTAHAGKRTPIKHKPNTPEFWATYYALLADKPGAAEDKSISAMINAFEKSPEWATLKPATHRNYRIYLGIIDERLGKFAAEDLTPRAVLELRDSFADRTVTANHIVALVKTLYRWGIPREFAQVNPAREIKRLEVDSEGMQPWPDTVIELAMTKARWEVRTFVALGLYTGQRTADILTMRLQDIEDDMIAVKQSKTKKRLLIPIHEKLAPVIAECRHRGRIYLLSGPKGDPLETNRWRALFGREGKRPGLEALKTVAPHGLRKSAVVTLREVGCPLEEISSITGQSRQMVEHYAKGVDQKMLAKRGMQRWEDAGKVVQMDGKTEDSSRSLK